MATRMVTLRLDPAEATLAQVRKKFDLAKGDLDENFGVASIDPSQKLFAILVNEKMASRLEGLPSVGGAFSNPHIDTFGPPM